MSDNIFTKNDPGWNQFASTGSIFDYLRYKHSDAIGSSCFDREVDDKGENCEDRDKRNSS